MYGLAPDVNAKAAEYFLRQLRHVQVALADGRLHLMGERFSSADILLTSCLDWAVGYKLTLFDSALAYLARMQAREAYQSAKRHNVPRVAGEPVLRRG